MNSTKSKLIDMPKCELHVHAEAIVSAETYFLLNQKYKAITDIATVEDFKNLFDIKSLKDMIDNFYLLQSLFRAEEDYVYLIKDVADYCEANNIIYMEMHFSPTMIRKNGYIPFDRVLEIVLEGLANLRKEGGPSVEIIVDISRSFHVDNAMENLDFVLNHNRKIAHKIIGIGFGGQEQGNSCLPYFKLFEKARANGLNVVIHAGEEVGPEYIWEALECKAQRIGHGTSAFKDPKLIAELRSRQIPLEICPTSNIITGKIVARYEDHPLATYHREGLAICINTDDPVLFNTTLNREFSLVHSKTSLSEEDLLAINRKAFTFAFSPEKERFLSMVDAWSKFPVT